MQNGPGTNWDNPVMGTTQFLGKTYSCPLTAWTVFSISCFKDGPVLVPSDGHRCPQASQGGCAKYRGLLASFGADLPKISFHPTTLCRHFQH